MSDDGRDGFRDSLHAEILGSIKRRLHELIDRAVDLFDAGQVSDGRRSMIEVKASLDRLERGAKEVTGQIRLDADPVTMCSDIYRPTWDPYHVVNDEDDDSGTVVLDLDDIEILIVDE